jgi:hypothetical protein
MVDINTSIKSFEIFKLLEKAQHRQINIAQKSYIFCESWEPKITSNLKHKYSNFLRTTGQCLRYVSDCQTNSTGLSIHVVLKTLFDEPGV